LIEATLVRRTGRELTDDDSRCWSRSEWSSRRPTRTFFQVATAHLSLGVELLDLDLPVEAVLDAGRIFTEHGRAIARN